MSDNTHIKATHDPKPQIAWCWASGLIEIGDAVPAGAIQIAHGSKDALAAKLSVLARHGKGNSHGQLLVPGVPEADGQRAKGDALAKWLAWCCGMKTLDGVVFTTMAMENA